MNEIKIKCEGCKNHCCGCNPHLTPVLLPSEEEKFERNSQKIKTVHRDMFILKKKPNGTCIFLDDSLIKCMSYEKRPLECRLYPFLLDFNDKKAGAKLDKRFCPNLNTLKFNKEEITEIINQFEFPEEWIKGYLSLTNF